VGVAVGLAVEAQLAGAASRSRAVRFTDAVLAMTDSWQDFEGVTDATPEYGVVLCAGLLAFGDQSVAEQVSAIEGEAVGL
jgi:hypothetical protein